MMRRRLLLRGTAAPLALAGLTLLGTAALPAAHAQDLQSFEARTTVHKIANGWTFVIVERPVAPVVSFVTIADVGSAQEVPGITGLAHMFEHMAFKGSQVFGSRDYAAEQKAIDAMEAAYQAYQAERLSPKPDAQKVERLHADFKKKQQEAASLVEPDAFDNVTSREGAVGLNASTAADATEYYLALPSNKIELFLFLESERFYRPVLREFYEERDVVMEERRMNTESQPVGRLYEQLLAAAYQAHPYQHRGIGHMSDLQSISITDAKAFFDKYYPPSSLVTAIVGDVRARDLIPMLEKYFGRIPARPAAPPLRTVEPRQIAEKTVVLYEEAQPFYLEAYHRPAFTHPDQPVYQAIDDILVNGRTSRLYRSLVRDKKLAVDVSSLPDLPGRKYPFLWIALVVPGFEVKNEQVQAVLHAELDRLKNEDVTDGELARFKTRAKADLLRSLSSNDGLALQLAQHQQLFGDWRELFRSMERIDRVTKADIRRVAGEFLRETNRTVAMIVTRSEEAK
ncbi:MAG TPA: pitrilysin family protein [Thermoanaerobaculia bacterium]|nr:pitrilysin family protein [Thermoanaerobaculia bacterium]